MFVIFVWSVLSWSGEPTVNPQSPLPVEIFDQLTESLEEEILGFEVSILEDENHIRARLFLEHPRLEKLALSFICEDDEALSLNCHPESVDLAKYSQSELEKEVAFGKREFRQAIEHAWQSQPDAKLYKVWRDSHLIWTRAGTKENRLEGYSHFHTNRRTGQRAFDWHRSSRSISLELNIVDREGAQ